MIAVYITDVTGQSHSVVIDHVRAATWTNPGASPYHIPPPPKPDTTVYLTLTMLDGPALTLTVRYAEVQYLERHYGAMIAQNAERYHRSQRAGARAVGR